MFGLSFNKLLLLAVLILIVWYGFKYAARIEAVKQSLRAEALRRRQGQGDGRGGARVGGGGDMRTTARPVEDLVKCQRCGSFVAAAGAANCGKPQCPWGA
ncbi:MAG TPA: hypothetical protein VHX19_21635 [Stellaceae bacterium]|jgi:uncharacterized protein|nr:hypothetical protein [Stellaceae bacterium]